MAAFDPRMMINEKGDKIAFGLAALSLVAFAVLTLLSAPSAMSITQFNSQLDAISQSVKTGDKLPVDKPKTTAAGIRGDHSAIDVSEARALADAEPKQLAADDYEMPRIALRLPDVAPDFQPPRWLPDNQSVVTYEQGRVKFRFIGTDHKDLYQYKIAYWRWIEEVPEGRGDQNIWYGGFVKIDPPNDYSNDERIDIGYKEYMIDINQGEQSVEFPGFALYTVDVGRNAAGSQNDPLVDNMVYGFRITPTKRGGSVPRFTGQAAERDPILYVLIRPVGEVVRMPRPPAIHVESAQLSGVRIAITPIQATAEYADIKASLPALETIHYEVFRWYDTDDFEVAQRDRSKGLIELFPAVDDPEFLCPIMRGPRPDSGIVFPFESDNRPVEFTDTGIEPERQIYYGVRIYHTESLPEDADTEVKLYEWVSKANIERAERNLGVLRIDPATNKYKLFKEEVYTSAVVLIPPDEVTELDNIPQVDVESVNVRDWPTDGSAKFLISKYFRVVEDDEEHYVLLGLEFTVRGGDDDQSVGSVDKPDFINGEKDRDRLRALDATFDFTTEFEVLSFWSYKLRNMYDPISGQTDDVEIEYVELVNRLHPEAWPIKRYTSDSLKPFGYDPTRTFGPTQDERRELYLSWKDKEGAVYPRLQDTVAEELGRPWDDEDTEMVTRRDAMFAGIDFTNWDFFWGLSNGVRAIPAHIAIREEALVNVFDQIHGKRDQPDDYSGLIEEAEAEGW